MPRREKEPIVRIHAHVYESDKEWLEATYGHTIGVARAVRQIIRGFRQKVDARIIDKVDEQLEEEVSLEQLALD